MNHSIKSVRAFVPSHITGFFAAHRKEEPRLAGSVGCGLCLSLGATTTIESASQIHDTEIYLNGVLSEAPVSRFVVEKLAKEPVRVKTELSMPFGAGFGASGAGALGCAYALNSYFDLGLTANGAAAVAHEAEVTNRTGLGDVIAQNAGGLVVRLQPGAPGIGRIDRIPVPPLPISYVVRGPISTSQVLSDEKVMTAVNLAGEAALKELLKRPTFTNFLQLSRRFTVQSGLASDWALEAIEAVEATGGIAGMIMLGDAVFAFGEAGAEALQSFGEVHTTTISQRGANLD
ncbi:MAG: pantoate kinase [Methanothrix sp.]|jgi:pantoate kinase|nr:pantoate kinase [Methanothrix sp.]